MSEPRMSPQVVIDALDSIEAGAGAQARVMQQSFVNDSASVQSAMLTRLPERKMEKYMKRLFACLLLTTGLVSSSFVYAEPVTSPTPARSTPTTKILAIGTINPGVKLEQLNAVLPGEVRDTVNLYLEGKIDQWYSLEGERPGVAFILNMSDLNAAHEMLERLPLGQAHMMKFELIPIGPLNPLRWLVEKPAKP